MSDQQQNADAPETDAQVDDNQQAEKPKPTETVDFWKQKAREQEKRAKDNADAAKRLAEIEDAQKSEAERSAERIKQLETELQAAHLGAVRFKIAAEFGLNEKASAALAHATSEEGMREMAEAFAESSDNRKKQGNYVAREGTTTATVESDEREVARALFGG